MAKPKKKTSNVSENLVARDLTDNPAQPSDQTSRKDYERNEQGTYGGRPEARKPSKKANRAD